MEILAILMICSALCIIPILAAGALVDIRERRFPKEYWNSWVVKVAGLFTTFSYLVMIADGNWYHVVCYVAISIVLALAFYGAGIRFGAGGDWRALIYIVVICPWLIAGTIVFSLIVGFAMAIGYLIIPKDPLDQTPIFARTIPFAVAIVIGYMASLALFILQNI